MAIVVGRDCPAQDFCCRAKPLGRFRTPSAQPLSAYRSQRPLCFAPSITREIGGARARVKSSKFQTETLPEAGAGCGGGKIVGRASAARRASPTCAEGGACACSDRTGSSPRQSFYVPPRRRSVSPLSRNAAQFTPAHETRGRPAEIAARRSARLTHGERRLNRATRPSDCIAAAHRLPP